MKVVPLTEAKARLYELVRDLASGDTLLLRHGRPVAALIEHQRYRRLVEARPRRETWGGPPPEIRDRLGAIRELCRRYHVRRLALFGSALGSGFDPERSDVDLLVEFEPMPPRARAESYFGLGEALEDLLGRSVDLVEREGVRNPYVRRSIEEAQAVLYAAA